MEDAGLQKPGNRIRVSVICNAFNQQAYIRETLESLVSQQTDFAYEILVHDDASTDQTPAIIREFAEKYPDLVRPLFQAENQYSKGARIYLDIQIPRARGDYLALCEGDDYWTDPLKLQKQLDAMERHPELDLCAHAASMVAADTKVFLRTLGPGTETRVIPVEEVIRGGGGFVATNSLFFRKSAYDRVPAFRRSFPFDYAMQIHGALRGGLLYLADNMSAYRVSAQGSWTVTIRKDLSQRVAFENRKLAMLQILDRETEGRYHAVIAETADQVEFNLLRYTDNCPEMMKPRWKPFRKKLPPKMRAHILLVARCPGLLGLYQKAKGKS